MSNPDNQAAAEHIIDLYDRHARNWAADRGNRLFETPWLKRCLDLVPGGTDVLDIGCGSAQPIARFFIEQCCRVTGVDSSPAMIETCRSHFPDQNWVVADMRVLSLGRTFSFILAWDSFFHLSPQDQRRMFPILRQHAADRAVLMFTSGPSHGEIIGSFRGEPLYHASLDPAEYCSLLERHGFSVMSHVVADPTCGFHTIWLAQTEKLR